MKAPVITPADPAKEEAARQRREALSGPKRHKPLKPAAPPLKPKRDTRAEIEAMKARLDAHYAGRRIPSRDEIDRVNARSRFAGLNGNPDSTTV